MYEMKAEGWNYF